MVKKYLGTKSVIIKHLYFRYRAVILSTTPAVKVKYIDYGNVSTEPIKEVRQITKELAQIPAEAIEVHFSTKVNIPIKDEIVLKVKFIEKVRYYILFVMHRLKILIQFGYLIHLVYYRQTMAATL